VRSARDEAREQQAIAVLRHAHDSQRRAASTLRRTALLLAARALAKDRDAMLTRCAWCERIELAGRWIMRERAPILPHDIGERITHGICPACVEVLHRSGRSR
jgi:hypothetical protein